jgi:hypothetical protein
VLGCGRRSDLKNHSYYKFNATSNKYSFETFTATRCVARLKKTRGARYSKNVAARFARLDIFTCAFCRAPAYILINRTDVIIQISKWNCSSNYRSPIFYQEAYHQDLLWQVYRRTSFYPRLHILTPCVMFDQPLFLKAVYIIKSRDCL